MADPTGGMFEARLKLADDSSEVIEAINDKIDKAVGNTETLQKEFKRLHERLDKMRTATKTVLKDTNNLGMIGSALLGTEDRGSIKEQFTSIRKLAGDLYKFLAGAAVDATLELADAALWAAEKVGTLYYYMSGIGVLMKFPAILAGSAIEATKLTGVIEDLRHSIILTNSEAASMGAMVSNTMLQTGSDIELVIDAMSELAHLSQLNTKGAEELTKATVYMAEAWRMGAGEVANFNRKIADLYQIGRPNVLGVASAMDFVSRSTAISRKELMGLIETLEDTLLYKIPKDLRSKVMPRMMADISAIAGEWANVFGDPRAVTEGFNKVLDIFDDQGQALRAMVVGLGGTTQQELQKMIEGGDAGGFWLAQLKAIQNLKKELGDERFTQVAGIYAEQMGKTREEFMKMSEMSIEATEARMKAAQEELDSSKSIREAWDRAMGVFNEVWKRLENIGKAILIGIGEPILNMLVPILDWFGKKLQWIIELFSGISSENKKLMGLAAVFGTIVAVMKSALIPAFKFLFTNFLVPLWATIGPAVTGFITGVLLPALAGIAIAIAKIIAIAAVFLVAIKAIYDWGGALLEGFAPAIEKIGTLFKMLGYYIAVVALPWLVALYEHWDTFYAAMKPGVDALKLAWMEVTDTFREVGAELASAFGTGSDESSTFFEIMSKGLKVVAKVIGTVVGAIARVIGWLVKIIGTAAAIIVFAFKPVIMIFGAIYDFIMAIIKGVAKVLNMIPGINIGGGTQEVATAAQAPNTAAQGGFVMQDGVQTELHKNEAVIPLEKFPEVVGSTVYVEQEMVVNEIKKLNATLERISRQGGLGAALQGG